MEYLASDKARKAITYILGLKSRANSLLVIFISNDMAMENVH
jgi:hypothetical protein